MRRLTTLLLTFALLVPGVPTHAANSESCAGLAPFQRELFAAGRHWLAATKSAGVGYMADPLRFGADDWSTFADLAIDKQEQLEAIETPEWVMPWMEVQIDAAALQADAGDAAAVGGIEALVAFSADFRLLQERELSAADSAVTRCPAFAQVVADWDTFDRDFEAAPATPENG